MPGKRGSPEERFWPKVERSGASGCWVWTAAVDRDLYGIFWDGRRYVRAHRYSYEAVHGEIPDGLVSDHLCRNHQCVNPAHIEIVTAQENTSRGLSGWNQAAKTHCPQGHPYTGENLIQNPRGDRACRTCKRASGSRRRIMAQNWRPEDDE